MKTLNNTLEKQIGLIFSGWLKTQVVVSSLTLILMLVPSTMSAQWNSVKRLLPSVFLACKAEYSPNDTNWKELSSDYGTISDNIANKYWTSIEEVTAQTGVDVQGKVQNQIRDFISSSDFQRSYSEIKALDKTLLYPNLLDTEKTSLRVYTKYTGLRVNKLLLADQFAEYASDSDKGFVYVLDQAIAKSEKWSGRVYKGVKDQAAEIARGWEVGEIVKYESYLSTSKEERVAMEFTNDRAPVILEYTNAEGVSVELISRHPYEKEIVLSRGSSFKVIRKMVTYDYDYDRLEDIEVTEILLEAIEPYDPKPPFLMEYESTGTIAETLLSMPPMSTSVSPETLINTVIKSNL